MQATVQATVNALLTDHGQFAMRRGFLEEGMDEAACFDLFVRRLPPKRNFLVAAGLEQALDFLDQLAFDADDTVHFQTLIAS